MAAGWALRSLVVGALCVTTSISIALAKPDLAFTRVHEQWLENYVNNLVLQTGRNLTSVEVDAAWCRAIEAWEKAYPGGARKLTFEALAKMRRFKLRCPKYRRIVLGPDARDTPQGTGGRLEGGSGGRVGVRSREDAATRQAAKDFIAWHPDEFTSAETCEEYVAKRMFVWYHSEPYERARAFAESADTFEKKKAAYDNLKRLTDQKEAEAKLEWLRMHPATAEEMSPVTPSGEKRRYTRADGAKVVEYTNGTTGIEHPDGREETIDKNGTRTIRYPDGRSETFHPDGTIEVVEGIGAARRRVIVEPDGYRQVFVGQAGDDYVGGYFPGLGFVRPSSGLSHPAVEAPLDGGALRNVLDAAEAEAARRKGAPLDDLERWEARDAALKKWEQQHPVGTRSGAQECERRTEAAKLREDQPVMEMRRRLRIAGGSVDPLDQVEAKQQQVQEQAGEGRRLIDLGQRQTGTIHPFVFEARNATCAEPQDFRFEPKNIPWLQFPQGNVARGIAQGQTKELPARLNFSQAPPGRYRGEVDVTCETCGWFVFKSCHIDKEVLELQVLVTPRLVQE
jgi:hypothetical protein